MEEIYLVEIRLGRTKWKINQINRSIARSFGIEQYREQHPHVTLYGPMELVDGVTDQQVLDAIGAVAAAYDPVAFILERFEKREGMHGGVIAFSVLPSDSLRTLTAGIAAALLPITRSLNAWDAQPERKWFHVTVANRLDLKTASGVFAALPGPDAPLSDPVSCPSALFKRFRFFLQQKFHLDCDDRISPVLLDETGLRITVMHGEGILAEYDLLEKRWLTDGCSHHSESWQRSLARFRRWAGFERLIPVPPEPGDIFLLADLHLGHANIIRYCSRPFSVSDTGAMDRSLIDTWNATILPGSRIYYLGDFCYGPDALPFERYREQLRGDIVFIAGNHDRDLPGSLHSATIEFLGERFFLVHDPADAPAGFDGWVVHGHHHNNDLRHYPFIDFVQRRINVSAEVAGYVPVSLLATMALIRYRTKTGNTKPVLLRYPYAE
jgi:calcineurin-like phosphoesterase family protein